MGKKQDEVGILYDYRRDGPINVGEAILWYEDGTTKRVKLKEDKSVVNGESGRRPIAQRSRVSAGAKHTQANTRLLTPGARIPMLQVNHKRQAIPGKRHTGLAEPSNQGVLIV